MNHTTGGRLLYRLNTDIAVFVTTTDLPVPMQQHLCGANAATI